MTKRQELVDAIRRRKFVVHECSFCEYPRGFEFRSGIFGYDNGCFTTDEWCACPEADLDFFLDPKHGYIKRINYFLDADRKNR